MAESEPKKTLESPFIGEAVCRSLLTLLSGRLTLSAKDQYLILGFGAVGESVAEALLRHFKLKPKQLHISELDQAKRNRARRQGFSIWERNVDRLTRFKLSWTARRAS